MEIKRVFLDKKIIFSFLLLMIACIGLYANSQYQAAKQNSVDFIFANEFRKELYDKYSKKSIDYIKVDAEEKYTHEKLLSQLMDYDSIKGNNYDEYITLWQDEETELRNSNVKIAAEFDKNKDTLDYKSIQTKIYVLDEILSQIQYIEHYDDYLSEIDSKATQLSAISIFSNNNSIASSNIKKTAADYARLKDITLAFGNDKPITSVIEFDLIHYLTFAFGIIIVIKFAEDRRRGLWSLVYSTPKGRTALVVKRAGTLLLGTVLSNIIIYLFLFLFSFFLYGGTNDLFRMVQSIELFQNFVFPMTELELILFYVLVNSITQFAAALSLWLIISFFQNFSIAIGVFGVFFSTEYVLYSVLPIQSNFAILKCLNLLYFINPTNAIIKYCNLNVFFFVVNLFGILLIFSIFFIVVMIALCLIVNTKIRPEKTPNRAEAALTRAFAKVKEIYWAIIEKLSISGFEFYKLLIIQKGWLVILVFVCILFNSMDNSKLYFSGTDSIINSFYEEYSGPVNQKTYDYLEKLETEITGIDNELTKAQADYSNHLITDDELFNAN